MWADMPVRQNDSGNKEQWTMDRTKAKEKLDR